MSEIRNLTRNGETFYPLTCSDAVLNRDGEPLGIINDIFDVSEYNASGTPPVLAKYNTLSLALAAIPTSKQKGGMTIRYVQSSDNKYVQYRLISDSFNTTLSDWQEDINVIGKNINADLDVVDDEYNVLLRLQDGEIRTKNFDSRSIGVVVEKQASSFDIEDENGNVVLRVKDGHVITKNFDSRNINNDLPDINIVGIGDSLTYGAGTTTANYSWFDILTNDLLGFGFSLKLAVNGAISTDIPGDTRSRIYNQISNIPQNANLITVMLCPNDYIMNTPPGNLEETMAMTSSELNHTTNFAISLRLDFETMLGNHPDAKVIMLLPMHQQIQVDSHYTYNYEDYRDIMIGMAEEFGIETIDLRKITEINLYVNYSRFMTDSTHPNDLGHDIIAKEVYRKIINIIKY